MSVEIEILNGNASWTLAEPLFHAIWPPEVLATLPWAGITFAHADLRVLVQDEAGDVVCHVGLYRRVITWNGQKINVGGIGGVLTRADVRNRGLATIALNAAIQTFAPRSRSISRFCSASRTAPPSTWRAVSSRSRAASLSSSRIKVACPSKRSRLTSTISSAPRRRWGRSTSAACPGEIAQGADTSS
jgi:hypothetical protein